jgi:hypothetical protein
MPVLTPLKYPSPSSPNSSPQGLSSPGEASSDPQTEMAPVLYSSRLGEWLLLSAQIGQVIVPVLQQSGI